MIFPPHVQELLEKRYFLKGEPFKNYYGHDGTENWELLCKRVAITVSKNNPSMCVPYFNMIHNLEFLPNSPTLFGAGVPGLCLSACFIAPMEDSIEGWANTFRAAMKIQTAGGGIGFALHKLRPSGSPVRGKIAHAAGPIEFMKCWNQISKSFRQAVRNGANMGQLIVSHPDVEEFITCKDKDGELSAFNVSVMITDEFMDCVKNKTSFNLTWNGKVCKTVDAVTLWNKICEHAWKTGEPGIIFYDKFQSSFPHDEDVYGNPCSEYTGPMNGACNLGSINLLSCATDIVNRKFDYSKFEEIICNSYTFLDDLIDINHYPTPEIDQKVKEYRQIGLGTMGFADVLVRFGIVYGSEECHKLANEIFDFKDNVEKRMNSELAKSRGAYPKCDIVKPMRNANTSTQAPTGSISMIAGVSASIEPIFSFEPITRIIDGVKKEIFSPVKHKDPKVNVNANQLGWLEHIETTGEIQKYVNMSISKTINLPHAATVEDVKNAFHYAFIYNLKGVTVYRDGCRANQTIQTEATKNIYDGGKKTTKGATVPDLDKITPVKRSGILSGRTFKDKIACGNLYTTINFDSDGNMLEVFVRPGKQGGCGSNVEAIARLLSMSLRSGVKVSEIVDQLKGIRCPACMAKKEHLKFTSCADSIAKAIEYSAKHKEDINIIKEKVKEIEEKIQLETTEIKSFKLKCPECGSVVSLEAGCQSCKNCGWSKCG